MSRKILAVLAAATLLACGTESPVESDVDVDTERQAFSSAEATLLDFEFDGELITRGFGGRSAIDEQMLYTMGHLNTHDSVGRLDKVSITNIASTQQADGTTKVTYHAKLPVAWGAKTNLPTEYKFRLPRNVAFDAIETFTKNYSGACADFSAHDVSSSNFWYYYRPLNRGCTIPDSELFLVTATATKSVENTTGKYPEYDKVWEDNVLNIVAIFGKYEDGATTASDAGISAFNNFVRAMKGELKPFGLVTVPANVMDAPGVGTPDVQFTATLPDGKKVVVTALLVDNVSTAGQTFYSRYEGLSATADVIMYNGHAGLGQNVRALAKRGKFVSGKYLIVFMNGCDTFAYVDGSLAQTRAVLNPDDPTGTKYMEILTNAMPAYFHSMPAASMALARGLIKHQTPMTYEQIFKQVDQVQVVVVTGEEDNQFTPGGTTFKGLHETGTVARGEERHFSAGTLPAGTYKVTLAPEVASATGDADLYVKRGSKPTTVSYDCRSFRRGSAEECTVTLTAPSELFLMVRGFAPASSAFVLSAETVNQP